MKDIVIRGHAYRPKFCSMLVLLKAIRIETKMEEAKTAEKWDEYSKLWLDKVDLFLEGETIYLNADNITAADFKELNDFFTDCLAANLPQSESSKSNSEDSTQSVAA